MSACSVIIGFGLFVNVFFFLLRTKMGKENEKQCVISRQEEDEEKKKVVRSLTLAHVNRMRRAHKHKSLIIFSVFVCWFDAIDWQ